MESERERPIIPLNRRSSGRPQNDVRWPTVLRDSNAKPKSNYDPEKSYLHDCETTGLYNDFHRFVFSLFRKQKSIRYRYILCTHLGTNLNIVIEYFLKKKNNNHCEFPNCVARNDVENLQGPTNLRHPSLLMWIRLPLILYVISLHGHGFRHRRVLLYGSGVFRGDEGAASPKMNNTIIKNCYF